MHVFVTESTGYIGSATSVICSGRATASRTLMRTTKEYT